MRRLVGLAENFTIYDTSDSRQVLRRTLDELDIDATLYTPERIAAAISWAKNNLITAAAVRGPAGQSAGQHRGSASIRPTRRGCWPSSAVDFDDLLLHVATLLRENPEIRAALDDRYRYILVDEYQDTNLAQYAIVRALSVDHPNLAVTGDPDQSIYGWRGANLSNILDFEHDYPERPRRQAGAELSQHEAHPARGRRADRLQPAAASRRDCTPRTTRAQRVRAGGLCHAAGRGREHRRADRRGDSRRPPPPARLRDLLSHQCPVAQPRIRAARRGHSLSDGQRRWSSTSARKSRTCWRICTCSTIRATTSRSCA